MRIAHETRQHVLLTTLGVLMIAVGISMLSNLWAHEHPNRAIPSAFEEVFVVGVVNLVDEIRARAANGLTKE